MTPAALALRDERLRAIWRPPLRVSLSAWADEHFRLPAGDAEAGRWVTHPYQREILDAMGDPTVERVSVLKSTQVGWSKLVQITLAFYIAHDPCRILVVQPAIDDAEKYSKEEIAPLLSGLPALRGLVADPKSRTADNAILFKAFRGGNLSLVGANSPRGFRRISRRVIAFEEPDEYPVSAGDQGDPIALAMRRSDAFWNRKIVAGSTPRLEGHSKIVELYEAGDQRRRYLPCPACGYYQPLEFEHLRWPEGKPEAAVFVCVDRGCTITHRQLRDMDAAGEWRPEKPEHFTESNRHRSFSIWAAYSYLPQVTWGAIAAQYVAAVRGGPDTHKTAVNTILGRPWKHRGDAPDWERLHARREPYAIGTCPPGVLFLTCGVDVQKDLLKYHVDGWGRGKESWVIDAGAMPGDTSDLERGPWVKLDALLARPFRHVYGVDLRIEMLAVDSGYNTQTVYAWARRYPMNRVIAIKGQESGHVLVSPPTPVEMSRRGRKLKGAYRVWPVCGHVAKSELYGWLSLPMPTSGEGYPPGFLHFPELAEEYFRELTAEHLVAVKNRRGFVRLEWALIPNRRNDWLDARGYSRAAAAVVGLDRFAESDWLALEAAVGKPVDLEPEVYDDEVPDAEAAEITA